MLKLILAQITTQNMPVKKDIRDIYSFPDFYPDPKRESMSEVNSADLMKIIYDRRRDIFEDENNIRDINEKQLATREELDELLQELNESIDDEYIYLLDLNTKKTG